VNRNDIAYTAKVSAAVWMIRKARKIARRLADATSEQQQAIESEIVEIGMRLYSETCEQPQPEVTHDPGEDHELEAYIAAVRELAPGADRALIQYWYDRRVPIQETAQKWLAFLAFTERQRKGVNP
jgi:hypothetical protein